MKSMNTYEKAVRIALILKDMRLSDFADELGISKPYLYDIITGSRKARAHRQRINAFLGIEDSNNPAIQESEWQTLEEYQNDIKALAKPFVSFETPSAAFHADNCSDDLFMSSVSA